MMKKLSKKGLIFICAALVISVLVGTASVLATNAIIESKSIGVDKALAVALEAKELDGADVEETSVKLRVRDGVAVYVVKLETEAVKYTVIVNAGTGEVIEVTEKECVKPEKPESPKETTPTEAPENNENTPETDNGAQDEKPKPDGGKHRGNGHSRKHGNKKFGGKDKNNTPPAETNAPEITA